MRNRKRSRRELLMTSTALAAGAMVMRPFDAFAQPSAGQETLGSRSSSIRPTYRRPATRSSIMLPVLPRSYARPCSSPGLGPGIRIFHGKCRCQGECCPNKGLFAESCQRRACSVVGTSKPRSGCGAARQAHREHRTFARFARHCYVAAHHARELAGDRKPKPGSAVAARGQ